MPYIKQDEPLKLECANFIESIREGREPVTNGRLGLEVVRILEAADQSLKQQGASVILEKPVVIGNGHANGNGKATGHGTGIIPRSRA